MGFSIATDHFGSRPFLWRNKVPTDLNDLSIPQHSRWYLQTTSAINDAGEIRGLGR